MKTSEAFKREITRVYRLSTDAVDFKSSTVFLDEDGSNIMVITENDNGSETFEFPLSNRKFSVLRGDISEL